MSIEGAAGLERLVELDDAAMQARPVFQQALAPDGDALPPVVDDRRREEVLGRRPCDRCGRISRTRQPVGPRHPIAWQEPAVWAALCGGVAFGRRAIRSVSPAGADGRGVDVLGTRRVPRGGRARGRCVVIVSNLPFIPMQPAVRLAEVTELAPLLAELLESQGQHLPDGTRDERADGGHHTCSAGLRTRCAVFDTTPARAVGLAGLLMNTQRFEIRENGWIEITTVLNRMDSWVD